MVLSPTLHRLCTDFGTEVHGRIIGETRAEYARLFSGKMKKEAVFFGEERKKCNFALEGSKTVRQPLGG
jgi:hypothetical protein